jgi:hypothetical protein
MHASLTTIKENKLVQVNVMVLLLWIIRKCGLPESCYCYDTAP